MQSFVGQKLGRYEIQAPIGQGGMAMVFKAYDTVLMRECAIKAMHPQFGSDPTFVERFQREAQAVARLQHPHILPVYDIGSEDGNLYIVMPLATGGTLDQKIVNGPLALAEVTAILGPVAEALDYAHRQGILHRDVKPSNIAFDDDDRPLLLDFGLAKLLASAGTMTLTGANIIGTPSYMAPEMIMAGGEVDPRTDIYALGVVAFELLTGQVPFTGGSPVQVITAIASDDPPTILSVRPELPAGLNPVFRQVLNRNPAERYQTAEAFVAALLEVTEAAGDKAQERLMGEPTPLPESREWATATVGGPAGPLGATGYYGRPLTRIGAEREADLAAPESEVVVGPAETAGPFDRLKNWLESLLGGTKESAQPLPGTSLPESESRRVPTIPPTVMEAARPTLILQENVQDFLAPAARHGVFELLSQQEPERIVNYITAYGSGRFLITGYGSFGGTSLTREIGRLVKRELLSPWSISQEYVLVVRLVDRQAMSNDICEFAAELQRSNAQDNPLGNYWLPLASGGSPAATDLGAGQPLYNLLDDLLALLNDNRRRSPVLAAIQEALEGRPRPQRLIVVLDKLWRPEEALALLAHPLWRTPNVSLLAVVEREQFNRWPRDGWSKLQSQGGFQPWSVPCLWEDEAKLVEQITNLLFRGYRLDSQEALNKYRLFRKHLAFIGRGQVGATIYELRQYHYWRIDSATNQPYISFDTLDNDLIRHHAWIYDLLESNWPRILGHSFPGQERTDRAKQGVYSFMDWVVDSATFSLEEALAEVDRRPVWISPHKRLRNEVALRVLEVLRESRYLDQYENEFDVVWGRELSPRREATVMRTLHAEEIEIWQRRRDQLLEDIAAASEQQGVALSEVTKRQLQRQIDKYEAELATINRKLASLLAAEEALGERQPVPASPPVATPPPSKPGQAGLA